MRRSDARALRVRSDDLSDDMKFDEVLLGRVDFSLRENMMCMWCGRYVVKDGINVVNKFRMINLRIGIK